VEGVATGVAMGEGRDVAMKEGSAPERRAQAPMTSAVNWALLGLVIKRPSYAYELSQRFERTYEGVLSLSSVSHVYTALSALESRALIEEVPGSGTGRQPKSHYRATVTGLESYRGWLVGQVAEERRSQRLFVLQLGALTRDPQLALEIVADYERACVEEAAWVPTAHQNGAAIGASLELLGKLLTEENRLAMAAKLEWLQYVREEFEALANGRVSDEPARARRQALPERATRARRAA
jgi:DNA-binding PadR family transcriptional regulator